MDWCSVLWCCPANTTLGQHQASIGQTSWVFCVVSHCPQCPLHHWTRCTNIEPESDAYCFLYLWSVEDACNSGQKLGCTKSAKYFVDRFVGMSKESIYGFLGMSEEPPFEWQRHNNKVIRIFWWASDWVVLWSQPLCTLSARGLNLDVESRHRAERVEHNILTVDT